MAVTHPYISGPGNITQIITHLRKTFPQTVNSDTVKKLALAPNNESYVINVLQFIGVLDKEGKKTASANEVFSKHKPEDFAKAFEKLITSSYAALFDLHGDGAWNLSNDDLITFFRETDKTGAAIGQRQAGTFKVLANLAGHGELQVPKATKSKTPNNISKTKSAVKTQSASALIIKTPTSNNFSGSKNDNNFGLTVRVEINLPSDGTKETYDNIFKSIRENLLNG